MFTESAPVRGATGGIESEWSSAAGGCSGSVEDEQAQTRSAARSRLMPRVDGEGPCAIQIGESEPRGVRREEQAAEDRELVRRGETHGVVEVLVAVADAGIDREDR